MSQGRPRHPMSKSEQLSGGDLWDKPTKPDEDLRLLAKTPGKEYARGHALRQQRVEKQRKRGKPITILPSRNPTLNDPTRERRSSKEEARKAQLESEIGASLRQRAPMRNVKGDHPLYEPEDEEAA